MSPTRAPAATGPSSVRPSTWRAALMRPVPARIKNTIQSSVSSIGSSRAALFSKLDARARCSSISIVALLSDELERGQRLLQLVVFDREIFRGLLARQARVVPVVRLQLFLPFVELEQLRERPVPESDLLRRHAFRPDDAAPVVHDRVD